MTDSKILPLLTWRSAICDSDLGSTTRHVALTLSLWMNEMAASAFPSVPTLAAATGLSDRAVRTHLHALVAACWLELVSASNGRQRGNEYRALTPERPAPVAAAPLHLASVTPASDDTNPCTTFSQSLQELSTNSSGVPADAGPDVRVSKLVAGYVDDYTAERDGHQPPVNFKRSCGRTVKQAIADGEAVEDIAVCLGVIAHESKNPSTLPYVLADYHAKRPRRAIR